MEIYVPDVYQKSIFDIKYDLLAQKGIRCLLFDLDNTIAPYNAKDIDEKTKQFFDQLKNNFQIILFSNSPTKRVKIFSDILNVDYMANTMKPYSKSFFQIFKKYKFGENEVAIIGDQLLTDVKGGNKIGITTVLVDPISDYDPYWTKINRFREKRLKSKLRKNDLFKGRFYDEKM